MDFNTFRLSKRLELQPRIISELYDRIASIDAVKQSWQLTGQLLPQSIERLTQSVIITSTGASNRIEGNRLNDEEIEDIYRQMRIRKMRTRDEQEVAGYLNTLKTVFDAYDAIPFSESSILQLHRDMLHYSEKDERHRGDYKFGSNRVEAKDAQGNIIGVIFDPTPPHLVKKEMHELVAWYEWAINTHYKHPLLVIANVMFEYLAIHPFQDGNGRTSRLLTNLLLLRHGYLFTHIVSHEKIIENNKAEYYRALNQSQTTWKTEAEDISPFLLFFLDVVQNQAQQATHLMQNDTIEHLLSAKQLALWQWANQLGERTFSRKEAIEALAYPPRTIEASIKKLLDMKRLIKHGEGRSTRYTVKSHF
jgi:Fic family protein